MAPLLAEISAIEADKNEDARVAQRRTLRLQVQAASSRSATGALIHNLSEHGLLIETAVALQVGETLRVDLPEAGSTAALVIWTRGTFFGCGFVSPVSKAAVSAALLRSPVGLPSQAAPKFPFAQDAVVSAADELALEQPASNSLLVILSLLLALAVVTTFIVALLTFPFAS